MKERVYSSTWRRSPQILTHRGWRLGLQVGFAIWLVLALSTLDPNWTRISDGWERGMRFVGGFIQPDFTSRWRDISNGLVESLTMTLTSTVAGIIISVPIGIGAARNVAPAWIYCQSARKVDPGSASKIDPPVVRNGERPTGWSWSGLRSPVGRG